MGVKQVGSTDLTVMLDSTSSSASSTGRASDACCGSKDAAAAPPKQPPAADQAAGGGSKPQQQRPRTYYVDWLRVFLTALVVVHHCVCTYLTGSVWASRKKGDQPLWMLSEFFVNANQAYFMTLFFFLSGLYVPGSFKRKGALSFLYDRTLRLVLPCLVYSFLVPPFVSWWNQLAAGKADADLGLAFRQYLTPSGWPTRYNIATGPPWFVWMLWCFNVAYVVLRVCGESSVGRCLGRCVSCQRKRFAQVGSSGALQELEARHAAQLARGGDFTPRQCIAGGAALVTVAAALCFAVRVVEVVVFRMRPATFFSRGPFVALMPDFAVVYALAFGLGTFSGPSGWDVLARLPAAWGSPCLWAAGAWWTLAGWMLNIIMFSMLALQRGTTPALGAWALRSFVEQSFALVWSVGLLVVFREYYNTKPGAFGRQVIGGAYGAYLVHMPVIALFGRALMPLVAPSYVVNAAALTVPVLLGSWAVACALRAIPYADRVL